MMVSKYRLYIAGIILLLAMFTTTIFTLQGLIDTAPRDPITEPTESPLRFIKNAGQLSAPVKYHVRINGGNMYFENQGLTYAFFEFPDLDEHPHHSHNPLSEEAETEGIRRKGHVLRVHFEGGNPQPLIEAGKQYPEYHNYFRGNDPSKWASRVPLYGVLTYQEIYTEVDMRLYGHGDALKYDFILAPGADASQIQLRYEGADGLYLQDGALVVETSVRSFTEHPPEAYQVINGKTQLVPCKYKLENKILSFDFPEGYDPQYELVIDPTLVFSTYSGSFSDNWGFTATYDFDGNGYGGGIEFEGGNGYPTTTGAIDDTYNGGTSDVAISKFTPDGANLIYSTYLGGFGDDQPHSMVANRNGELYIFGRTSSFDFPISTSAYDPSQNGGFDVFVTKLSADGTVLIGSTFLGGAGDDGVNGSSDFTVFTSLKVNYGDDARGDIIVDGDDNCYVAACTFSTDFPTSNNAFQRFSSGGQDGCVFKLNANLSQLVWSSYLGGRDDDAAYAIQLDGANNVYVSGGTRSTNFPGTAGGFNPAYQGGFSDGFVSKISSDGATLEQSTYIGTNDYDQSYLIQLDQENNVYVSGQTVGNYPVVEVPGKSIYSNPGATQFITKFNNALDEIILSTVFGSPNASRPNISPTAFLVDKCDNIYVSGWGGETNQENGGTTDNMPITSDAFQANTDGSDIYLIVLSRDAETLKYGTYLGGSTGRGEHVDGGTSRFDREGIVYHAVCAGCGGTSAFPTTPGVVSRNNNSDNCNLALFKLALEPDLVVAEFTPRDNDNNPVELFQGCPPLEVRFQNTSTSASNSVEYFWDFGDGQSTSNEFEPVFTYSDPGTYEVMMIISDPNSCNESDTTFKSIQVFAPPIADAGPDRTVCVGEQVALQGSGGVSYSWSPTTGLSNPNIANPTASPTQDTEYILTITDVNGCQATDTVEVRIDDNFPVEAGGNQSVCVGGSTQLNATANNATTYTWSPAALLDNPNIPNPQVTNIQATTTFYVTASNANGCTGMDSVVIEIFDLELLADTTICEGTSVVLQSTSNGVSFSWTPAAGLDNPNIANPTATPTATTTYTVTATSTDGCTSTKSVTVTLSPAPQANAGEDQTICFGESTRLQGSGGTFYQWSPDFFLIDPNTANPSASPQTDITYTLTVIDDNGCTATDEVNIIVNQGPTVTAGPDQQICEGETVQLEASGALDYQWDANPSLSNLFISNPTATPVASTTFVVTGSDANGCTNSDEVIVTVNPIPEGRIRAVNRLCVGEGIQLVASGADSYVWSTGETTSTISVFPQGPTTYSVTPFLAGCEGEPVEITVDDNINLPIAEFTLDSLTNNYAPLEVTFINQSQNAETYEWNFGTGGPPDTRENPTFTFPHAGEFTVQLIAFSIDGCPDTTTLVVSVDNVLLHIPNAFTPNQDNTNNEFFVRYQGIQSLTIHIFNRWGKMIYSADDPDFRWDGLYKGKAVPEGVYVYVIEGIGENGLSYQRNGSITVIR